MNERIRLSRCYCNSFYCVVLMLFLFRASCFWEAVPIDTPLIKHLPFSAFSATYAPISSRTRITTYADAIRENLTHALTTDAGVRPDHAAAVAAALQLPALVQPADWCWCDLGLGVGLGIEFFGSRAQDEGREQSTGGEGGEGRGKSDGRSAKPKASSALTRLFEPRDVSAWEMETVRRAQRALVARVKHATEAERVRREREEQQQREREREEKEREREKEAEGEAVAGTDGTSHSHAYAQGDEEELTQNGDATPPSQQQQQQQRGKRRQELFYRLRRLVKPDTSTISTAVPTASTALPSPFSTSSSIDSSSPSSPSPPLAASSPPPAPAPPPPSPPAPTVNSTFASEPSTPPRKWFYDLRAYGLDITVDFNWSRR